MVESERKNRNSCGCGAWRQGRRDHAWNGIEIKVNVVEHGEVQGYKKARETNQAMAMDGEEPHA